MKVYKVVVTKEDKQYLTVAPLVESKVRDRALSLHRKYPCGTVTVSETTDPSEGWNEVWVISPELGEVETYIEGGCDG